MACLVPCCCASCRTHAVHRECVPIHVVLKVTYLLAKKLSVAFVGDCPVDVSLCHIHRVLVEYASRLLEKLISSLFVSLPCSDEKQNVSELGVCFRSWLEIHLSIRHAQCCRLCNQTVLNMFENLHKFPVRQVSTQGFRAD